MRISSASLLEDLHHVNTIQNFIGMVATQVYVNRSTLFFIYALEQDSTVTSSSCACIYEMVLQHLSKLALSNDLINGHRCLVNLRTKYFSKSVKRKHSW